MVLQRIFVDAGVLASRTQHDWLTLLRDETGDWFQLHSSSDLVEAAVRAWVERDPAARAAAAGRRLEALVASLDEVVETPDEAEAGGSPSTRTLVQRATAGRAHVLLTSPALEVTGDDDLPFEIHTTDEFLCLLDDSAARHVRSAAILQAERARRAAGARTDDALRDALIAAGCPAFAERVCAHLRSRAA